MDFTGKTAFVTGGAVGIGKAAVEILVNHGARVAVTDINTHGLELLQRAYPQAVVTYYCDVTDEASVRETVSRATEALGKIDILINNAGIFDVDRAPFVDQTPAIWKKKIDVNIWGTLYPTHAVMVSFAEITRPVIEAMENCKVIIRCGMGVNNVDIPAATEKKIPVANVQKYCLEEVSDHALALALTLQRRIGYMDRCVRSGIWDASKARLPPYGDSRAVVYVIQSSSSA